MNNPPAVYECLGLSSQMIVKAAGENDRDQAIVFLCAAEQWLRLGLGQAAIEESRERHGWSEHPLTPERAPEIEYS